MNGTVTKSGYSILQTAPFIYIQLIINLQSGGVQMIFLMKHGADAPNRYGGWSHFGLTDIGKQQVCAAKLQLLNKGITEIYSSDLSPRKRNRRELYNIKRARQTITVRLVLYFL